MIKWMLKPQSKIVAKYVDCYWFLDTDTESVEHTYPKLNPDPAATLIIATNDQPYGYDLGAQQFNGFGSHWIFPYTQTMKLDHSKPLQLIGIKFHVGALYSLNLNLKQPVIDKVLNAQLTDILSDESEEQIALLSYANTDPQRCCNILDEQLFTWLDNGTEDKYSIVTNQSIDLLTHTKISEIGSKLNCSQRTIERSFVKVTGITLKQCQSMNRLEAILEYLYQRQADDIDWAQIAYQFGFSDQPHLIRYFKKVIGSTPENYTNQRDLTIDIYGGVQSK